MKIMTGICWAFAAALLVVPERAHGAQRCEREYENMLETLESADVYCSMPVNEHTNLLCASAIKIYDAYLAIYEDCMRRDDEVPYD